MACLLSESPGMLCSRDAVVNKAATLCLTRMFLMRNWGAENPQCGLPWIVIPGPSAGGK